jgi:hypothetical protein
MVDQLMKAETSCIFARKSLSNKSRKKMYIFLLPNYKGWVAHQDGDHVITACLVLFKKITHAVDQSCPSIYLSMYGLASTLLSFQKFASLFTLLS